MATYDEDSADGREENGNNWENCFQRSDPETYFPSTCPDDFFGRAPGQPGLWLRVFFGRCGGERGAMQKMLYVITP